jgi:hypothetical protein
LEDLKDIYTITDIPDISLYIIFLIFLLVGIIIIILFKLFKFKKSPKEILLQKLENISLENPKESAYQLTNILREAREYLIQKDIIDDLIISLSIYKYRATVPKIHIDIIKKIDIIKEMLK